MKQQAVHDYVKKKRGLYAAKGGEVPDEEDDLPEEDVPEEAPPAEEPGGGPPAEEAEEEPAPEEEVPAGDNPEATVDRPLAPAQPMDRAGAIKAHLAQQYAQAADTQGVEAARRGRNAQNLVSNLFEGAEGIARAGGQPYGGEGVDHANYRANRAGNDKKVQEAEGDRQNKIQGFLRQNELDRQVAADAMKSRDAARKDAGAKLTADMNDPASPYSRSRQAAFGQLWAKQLGGIDVSKLSVPDMKDLAVQLEKKGAIEQRDKKAGDEHSVAMAKVGAYSAAKTAGAEAKAEAVDTKRSEKQADAYVKARAAVENFRGNSAVQKAAVAVQGVKRALAPLNNRDPNTLTTQDLSLLADEVGAVALGGVPSEHGIVAIMPSNLQTKYAEMKNFLSSKPTDAQAGEYVKKNIKYLNDMGEVSAAALHDYRKNISKGFKHKLSPEDYAELQADYGLADAKVEEKAPAPAPPVSGPGMLNAAPAGAEPPAAAVHPKASAAATWAAANQNSKNPLTAAKAKEILNRLGGP